MLLAYCQSQAAWRAAGIGAGHGTNLAIRGDRTHWLSSKNGAVEADVLAMLDRLRCALNQTLWLNLASVEAHFAHYAPGTGYARHKDVFQRDAQRVIFFRALSQSRVAARRWWQASAVFARRRAVCATDRPTRRAIC